MYSLLLFTGLCWLVGVSAEATSSRSSPYCVALNHVLNCFSSKTEANLFYDVHQANAPSLHQIDSDIIGSKAVLGDASACDDPTAPSYIRTIAPSGLAVFQNVHDLQWQVCGQAFNMLSSTSPLQAFHQLSNVKLMTPQEGIHACVFSSLRSLRTLIINCKSNLPSHLSVSKDIQMVRLVYCTDVPIQVNCRRCVDNGRGEDRQIVLQFLEGPRQLEPNVILRMQQDCSTDICKNEEVCPMEQEEEEREREATKELPMEVPRKLTSLPSIAIVSQIHNGSNPAPSTSASVVEEKVKPIPFSSRLLSTSSSIVTAKSKEESPHHLPFPSTDNSILLPEEIVGKQSFPSLEPCSNSLLLWAFVVSLILNGVLFVICMMCWCCHRNVKDQTRDRGKEFGLIHHNNNNSSHQYNSV